MKKRNLIGKTLALLCLVWLIPIASIAQVKVVVVPLGGDTPESKYIFVTRGVWTGDLGGWQGADAKCQTEADAAGSLVAGRNFKAWITGRPASDQSLDGSLSQITQWHGRYIQPTGLLVAKNFIDLIENGPSNFITQHADGETDTASIDTFVWTGIESDGS
ncbi:MAG: hypothetical protein KTR16_07430, partial [Acidiferrobacterales bacterium]|nr:hypothetical protein [Acidiferrobacterales bacterium]